MRAGVPGDERPRLSTDQKALRVNLDPVRYGTFAEIGAGQEVARWFFKVGGAAGTISKSISAYDMAVSDAIYGRSKRYVSRERLQSMLDYEHGLNLERLKPSRGDSTAFFTFADTVAARNYHGTNECHGWLGVKYQAHPRDEDSQIIIHVRMLDDENAQQQEALGIVGVNLLYAACFLHHKPERMLESLLDNLSTKRLEIDMVEFSGIEFRHVDNRVMSLKLVQLGLSGAAMFGPSGDVLQPSEVLRKRPILVERGSFRPVTKVNIDMIDCARQRFAAEREVQADQIVELMEITMRNLLATGAIDLSDFLARADVLATAGKTVLISDYFEYFRLAAYLTRYTSEPIAVTMGVASLQDLFKEQYYDGLEGGILEAFGKLFTKDLRIYAYPLLDQSTGSLTTVENVAMPGDVQSLYRHLVDRGRIKQLDNFDASVLHIFSRDVLRRIKECDAAWEEMVPPEIAALIKRRLLFGYREAELREGRDCPSAEAHIRLC
ncbi:MAG: nicotinate-nucleotide adenylyltransferase [Terriglobia bacterium]|nr:MAG: nicotinate-nucleotide adenylyltransferase [Terriglobia bacterium]